LVQFWERGSFSFRPSLTRKLGTPIVEFGIQATGIRLRPLDLQPALIDRAYDRLVEAIADGASPMNRYASLRPQEAWASR